MPSSDVVKGVKPYYVSQWITGSQASVREYRHNCDSLEDAEIGRSNRSGIADETLYQLAVDMRSTAPGDVYGYCSKWVEFQEQWSQILPALPVYSNVYFDFYSPSLQNYNVVDGIGWSQAIVGAYIGEAVEEPAAETAAEEDEFSE